MGKDESKIRGYKNRIGTNKSRIRWSTVIRIALKNKELD